MWPILVNKENETLKISSNFTKVLDCNLKEGGTRMIFHALQQKTNVLVCSKNTDIVVLVVFACALNLMRRWLWKLRLSLSILVKLQNFSDLTLQQNFTKFIQLRCVIQLLSYMLLGKLKSLNLNGKEKRSDFWTQLVFPAKFETQQLKM